MYLDERVFTLDDIRLLLFRQAGNLKKAIILGAVLSFLFLAFREPTFEIEATFKDGIEKPDFSIKDFFLKGMKSAEPQAMAVMKSHRVLFPLVEKYGLQATVPRSSSLFTLCRHLYGQFCAEFELPLPEIDWFLFENVHFEGERKVVMKIQFTDPTHFQVLERGKVATTGVIGKPVHVGKAAFTVAKVPSTLLLRKPYRLELTPFPRVLKQLRNKLQITAQKNNKSLYDLRLRFDHRYVGTALLNDLMERYRSYLKQSHEADSEEQIVYLEKKQAELFEKMEQVLDDHVQYLKTREGFVGFAQEMKREQELRAKLQALNFELELPIGNELALGKIADLERQKELFFTHSEELASLDIPAVRSEEMDLATARLLFAETAKQLDGANAAMSMYHKIQEELDDCEWGSLKLKDPMSQTLIERSIAIELKLKDTKHSSPIERARGKEELDLNKKILSEHLDHLSKMEQIHAEALKEKMVFLQQMSRQCADQELIALDRHVEKITEKRREQLIKEKELLERKLEEFKSLPDTWKAEHWLELKTEAGKKMVAALSELVQTKTIARHLHVVEAKPLDSALVPMSAKNPHLFLLTLLGAFLGGLSVFVFAFFYSVFNGFPVTGRMLMAMGHSFSGNLQSELETFRRLSLFIGSSKTVALLGGVGPDYAAAFAAYRKARLVRVESMETLKREEAEETVFFWSEAPLDGAESLAILQLSDKAIVTLSGERTEQLTELLDWGYHDGHCRMSFIS